MTNRPPIRPLRARPPLGLLAASITLLLAACDPALREPAGAGATTSSAAAMAIGQVQGSAAATPLAGETVTVEGVVTFDARGPRGLGGVFVQDTGDGNPLTSDALLVLDSPTLGAPLAPGQRLRIRGRVLEQDGGRGVSVTALAPDTVERIGTTEPAPTRVRTPPPDWERLEGMWLQIDAPLSIAGTRDFGRYGEVLASFDGRLWQPGELAAPGSSKARAVAADNARRRLVLDDGRVGEPRPGARADGNAGDDASAGLADTAPWPPQVAQVRTGSLVVGAQGIVDHRHGEYRLQLTATPTVEAQSRPAAPQVAGDLRIASFNLENYFNGDGRGGGFPTPRGAADAAELAAQQGRLVATIQALAPDVAALMELENDGYGPRSSIAQLVGALNRADAGADWRFVDAGQGPGQDEIRVGVIYRADAVRPKGNPATLSRGPFARLSRAPLAQAFVPIDAAGKVDGPAFVVVANHFKSKGCGQARGADRDQGDGAGCWNAARTESARLLHQWLATDPTGVGTDRVVLLGDLNAYAREEPLQVLARAGWRDALGMPGGAARYSYVYDGQLGRLDHALLSPSMAAHLRGGAVWHSNADEPVSRSGPAAGGAAATWRSSDHDPLLLGFALRGPAASGG